MFCVAWAQEQPLHPYQPPMCNGPWCVHSDLCSKMPNPPISSSLPCISFTLHCSSSRGSVSVLCMGQQSQGLPNSPRKCQYKPFTARTASRSRIAFHWYVFHWSAFHWYIFHLRILLQFRISPPYFICSAGLSPIKASHFEHSTNNQFLELHCTGNLFIKLIRGQNLESVKLETAMMPFTKPFTPSLPLSCKE